jgi:preprotein translocase SecE subunit
VANKMAEKKKSTGRSQTAELKTRGKEKEQPAKSARVATREVRKEQKTESKAAPRRENKGSPIAARIRSNRIGRFILEAYYELRHKVTWPTFEQARNMTIAVIVISVLVGALLAAADFGLYHLFLLIIGGGK